MEGQLDKFYDWLHIHCRNEEKEVYIEHSFVERMSTVKTAQHKFKKACVPAQMMVRISKSISWFLGISFLFLFDWL